MEFGRASERSFKVVVTRNQLSEGVQIFLRPYYWPFRVLSMVGLVKYDVLSERRGGRRIYTWVFRTWRFYCRALRYEIVKHCLININKEKEGVLLKNKNPIHIKYL